MSLRLKSDLLFESRLYYLTAVIFLFVAISACTSTDADTDDGPNIAGQVTVIPTPAVSKVGDETTVVIHISPTGEDGQTGTARFISGDSSETLIQISISPAFSEAQPIHLHSGTCDDIGPVLHGLQNVVKVDSVTLIGIPIEDISRNGALVNVHASYADSSNYTGCGEIPEMQP